MKYGSLPTPCATGHYGEVEDYTVNITAEPNGQAAAFEFAEQLGQAHDEMLTLSPNPTSSTLYVNFGSIDGATPIRIYNAQGHLVLRTLTNGAQTAIDVSALANGVYIVTVDDPHGTITQKFVKQ